MPKRTAKDNSSWSPRFTPKELLAIREKRRSEFLCSAREAIQEKVVYANALGNTRIDYPVSDPCLVDTLADELRKLGFLVEVKNSGTHPEFQTTTLIILW